MEEIEIKKLENSDWGWKIEYKGLFYGEVIKQQEGKELLTKEKIEEIATRRWKKDKEIIDKYAKNTAFVGVRN